MLLYTKAWIKLYTTNKPLSELTLCIGAPRHHIQLERWCHVILDKRESIEAQANALVLTSVKV